MNEGGESSAELTPEQELLIKGCKSYLDVIHATNAFQTRVCNAARDVISEERDRISKIAKLAKPLESPANAFVYPAGADNNFDGSQAWVGAYIWLDRPVGATLYLALVFHRDPNSDQQPANICFALQVGTRSRIRQYGNILGRTNTARSMTTTGIGLRLNYDSRWWIR